MTLSAGLVEVVYHAVGSHRRPPGGLVLGFLSGVAGVYKEIIGSLHNHILTFRALD